MWMIPDLYWVSLTRRSCENSKVVSGIDICCDCERILKMLALHAADNVMTNVI